MFNAVGEAFVMLFQPGSLLAALFGLVVGLVVGIIPGIGGPFALALLMPLTFTMDPTFGVVLLITITSVVVTGGMVPAVLIGIPGTPTNAANILDGYPMTKKGQGGRALGASLTAAGIAGLIGAIVLMVVLPFMRPLILTFGHPELFAISAFGLCFVAILSEGMLSRALLTTVMGIVFACVGMNPLTGVPRFHLGLLYLWDGVPMIPVILGLFALPEIMDMYLGKEKAQSKLNMDITKDIMQGVMDVFKHWFLFIRCSIIGAIIGMIPGLGGETSSFLAYGHAKQSTKKPEEFGNGSIEGVIAPSAAVTGKEGGALVPTLGFGIPGSTIMAILLGALTILGYQPGPAMLASDAGTIQLIAVLTGLMNLVGSFVCLLFAKQMVKLASIKSEYLLPWVCMFIMVGAYVPNRSFGDVFITFASGVLGYFMKEYKYPRIGLLLAMVLTFKMELNYFMAMDRFGIRMLTRPVVMVIIALIIISLGNDFWKKYRKGKAGYSK